MNSITSSPYHPVARRSLPTAVIIAAGLGLAVILGYAIPSSGIKLVVLTIGTLLAIVLWIRPQLAFVFFWVSIMSLGPAFPVVRLGLQINVMDVILLIGAGRLILDRIMSYRAFPRISRAGKSFLLYLLLTTVLGTVVNPLQAVAQELRIFFCLGMGWLWVVLLSEFVVVERLLLYALSVGSMFTALKALLVFLGFFRGVPADYLQAVWFPSPELGVGRAMVLGADVLLPAAIPLFVSVLLYGSERRKRLLTVAVVSAAFGLFLGFSRATWLGALGGTVVTVWLIGRWEGRHSERFQRYLNFFVAAFLTLVIGSAALQIGLDLAPVDLVRRRFSGEYDLGGSYGFEYRQRELSAALPALQKNPLLGQGLGGTFYFRDFRASYIRELTWTHSGWVWLALKGGLVGMALFLYPFLTLFRRCRLGLRAGHSIIPLSGLCGAITAMGISAFFRNPFASVEGGAFLGIWLGVMAIKSFDTEHRNPRPQGFLAKS